MMNERTAWRCFPWNPDAALGAPFSTTHIVPGQTVGRFDLQDRPSVRYLAESPEHAIGEVLSPFRGTTFSPAYLRQQGHDLALVEVTISPSLVARIADCTNPETLVALELRPDDLAHHDRALTQAIAHRLHTTTPQGVEYAGLRWWSALTGAWHTNVLFTDREQPGHVTFGTPQRLRKDDPALARTLSLLGIRRR
jgi:hypothetical protein